MLSAMHSTRRVHVFVFYTVLQKVASANNGLVFYNTCMSFTMTNSTNFLLMHLLSVVINQGKSRRNSHDRVYSNFTLF